MIRFVVLDSSPLGLLTQRPGLPIADQCKAWATQRRSVGATLVVPEIVDYELRRELLRLQNHSAIARLDAVVNSADVLYIPLSTSAMRLASELWAKLRREGRPTADPSALDIDVILAAQVQSLSQPPADVIVATANVGHLSRLVAAADWQAIA